MLNFRCDFRRVRLCALLASLLAMLNALPSLADSWNTRGDASINWLYNDNPTLRQNNSPLQRQATSYGRAQVRGTLEYSTPQLFIDIAPRISQTYFPDPEDSDLQNTDFYFDSNADYTMRRNDLGMIVNYSNVGLLTDEFGDGIDTPPGNGATGSSLRVDDQVQRYLITPEWNHQLTRKDTLSLGLTYFGTDYKLEKTNRADNTNEQVRLGYTRRLTARWSMGLSGTARRFESNKLAPIPVIDIELTNSSDSIGVSFDTNFAFSEKTTVGINIGRTEITSTRDALFFTNLNTPIVLQTESSSTNTTYNFTLNHTGERNSVNLLVSHAIVPSSQGFENSQISVNLLARRRLSEFFTGIIRINFIDQQAINTLQRIDSSFILFTANTSLAWRFSRNWSTSAVYTYRRNNSEFGDASQLGESNQVGATLTYRWD